MTARHALAALTVAVTFALTACSATEAPRPVQTMAAAMPTAAPTPTPTYTPCPALTDGEVVAPRAFASCLADETGQVSGYAATGTVQGTDASLKFDPATDSLDLRTGEGDIRTSGAEVWVRAPEGEWVSADPTSDDSRIRTLSKLGTRAATALPGFISGAAMSDLTVVGREGDGAAERITLRSEENAPDASIIGTYVVTSNYDLVSVSFAVRMGDREMSADLSVSEWNKAQDIAHPR